MFLRKMIFVMSSFCILILVHWLWKLPRDELTLYSQHVTSSKPDNGKTALSNEKKYPEVRHIVFLKVHKAASSTMLNIFYRFGTSRHLTFVLPKVSNYIMYSRQFSNILPPVRNSTFDIVCNHVIFNHDLFKDVMPRDSVYIGIVREPLHRLFSAFVYYRTTFQTPYLKQIDNQLVGHSKTDEVSSFKRYLQHPLRYETITPIESMTNNKMAVDFGFPQQHFNDISTFKKYLKSLDNNFVIVMVSELFDESIILMKRLLHWKIKDVVYISKNRMQHPGFPSLSNETLSRAKSFLRLDYLLYEYFLQRLKQKIDLQGVDFHAEVKYFKRIQEQLQTFCLGADTGLNDSTVFPATQWNEQFSIDRPECELVNRDEITFLNKIRKAHLRRLDKYGDNKEWASVLQYKRLTKQQYTSKQYNLTEWWEAN